MTHRPTDETRAIVSALYSYGHTQAEIGQYLGICDDTVAFHYSRELATARISANAEVAKKLFNKAVYQDDLGAQIFWLKTRARWRTQDAETLADQNESLREELKVLREEMDAKNKKEY